MGLERLRLYVYVDGIYLKRSWGGSYENVAVMVASIADVFPEAAYQRCTVHFYRNVLAKVPKSKRPRVAAMLKAIYACFCQSLSFMCGTAVFQP